MLTKINNTLAYRLPSLYKAILSRKKINKISKKSALDWTLVSMTGKAHLDLLKLSLYSIGKSWSTIPRLIIYNDGSISNLVILKKLSFWPDDIEIKSWEESRDHHLKKERFQLGKYADSHVFGKKMAVILKEAENSKVLWIDSDILFYNDFVPFLPTESSPFFCGGTEDWIKAYDTELPAEVRNEAEKLPSFNAGMLAIKGQNIYENFDLENILKHVEGKYTFFTEQTIFAYLAAQSNGIVWNLQVMCNFNGDQLSNKPTPKKKLLARHYTTNVRHLFWRDAMFHFSGLLK